MWLPQETFNSNKRGDWQKKYLKWNVTLKKWWNWSSCTKQALSASWTHGLIAQSIRTSDRVYVYIYFYIYIHIYIHIYVYIYIYIYMYYVLYYVYMGSNPTQANFPQLPQRNLQYWIPYVSVHSATLVIHIWKTATIKGTVTTIPLMSELF